MRLSAIFENGRINTQRPKRMMATKIGILNGAIVGIDDEIDGLPADRRYDLCGNWVVPGFNDAHHHLSMHGHRLNTLDLRYSAGVDTLGKLYAAVSARAETLREGEWVEGAGYDDNKLQGHPERRALDNASKGHPVWLEHVSGHMGVANTLALRLSVGHDDISKLEDEPGGLVYRGPDGSPTGLLQERAMEIVTARSILPRSISTILRDIATGSDAALECGITSITDPGVGTIHGIGSSPMEVAAYQAAREAGKLRVRATLMPYFTALHEFDSLRMNERDRYRGIDLGIRTGFGDEWVRLGPIKILADGSLIGRTAAVIDDFAGEFGNKGFMRHQPSELDEIIVAAHRAGWQVAAHAIGDRTIDAVLDAFELAQAAEPRPDPRFRIEHFSITSERQVERAARLGVVAVPQGRFISETGVGLAHAVGPAREDRLYRMQTLLSKGMVLPGSSDSPVVDCQPLLGMHDMVNRMDANGHILGPSERLTAAQALRAYTYGSAYAAKEEDRKGILTTGCLADFTVLSDDLLTVDPLSIGSIKVGATVVGGALMYNDGAIRER